MIISDYAGARSGHVEESDGEGLFVCNATHLGRMALHTRRCVYTLRTGQGA
jgi:hypothetical protein